MDQESQTLLPLRQLPVQDEINIIFSNVNIEVLFFVISLGFQVFMLKFAAH